MDKKVYHIVLLTFKAEAEKQGEPLFVALGELARQLNVLDYSYGPNHSVEGLHAGFTYAFVMTFTDRAARDHYLDHPVHEQIKQQFLPQVANVLVFDYEG